MPRKPRIHVPGAFYHVTLRGNHRQDIFFCEQHRHWLDEIVAEAIQRFGARVHAYCWMTNHIHLLVQVSDAPLGRVMLRIASLYARRVQAHMTTTGHLFERRYHAVLVDADEYLLSLLRYIHLNPVRAKLVIHPSDYVWSSHAAYLGLIERQWVTTAFALNLFHVDQQRAVSVYDAMISDDLHDPRPAPFTDLNDQDRRVLGNDDFLAHVHGLAWRPRSRRSLDEVIANACREFAVTQDALHSRSAKRALAKVRAWIAQHCIDHRIASISEVARRFDRDESTLRESMLRYFPPH